MTKRSQTTGLPKTAPKRTSAEPAEGSPTPQRKLSRREEYHSRAEREAQLQRRIVIGIIALAAALAVIVAVAVVIDQIIIPGQVVASVEGKNITVSDFQKRVRFERATRIQQLISGFNTYQSFGIDPQQLLSQDPYRTWMSDLDIPAQLGTTVINDMVEDQLVRNEAAARSLTVTQEDIQKQIEQYFGFNPQDAAAEATAEVTATVEPSATPTPFVSPTPSPTPTITPTPELTATVTATPFPTIPPEPTLTGTQQYEQFNTNRIEYFNTMRRDARLSDGDLNAFFEMRALREKLRDAVTTDITKNAPFVDARHILVATEEEAQDVIKALENGESFAELARAISTDTGSGANGGELGWAPIYQYVKPFADAARDAGIGAIVGPVQSEFGYHIIQVRARENRDMSDDQLENAKNGVFAEWLKAQQESKQDQISISDIWSNYVPDDPPSPFRTQ